MRAPVFASSAYVVPLSVAKYTRPATTVGDPEIGPLAVNFHRTFPVAASRQKNVCE